MILETRGKPILSMMETIRTKIMFPIVKKKEEADKWKGMLCPKIKKKLDVNKKDSLRNWDVTGIPYMYALALIHLKDEFLKTYTTPNQQEGTLTQQAAPTQLPTTPTHQQAALREKLPFKRKPTTVRRMPPTQESSVTDH
ncbi:hypothetical protein GOBAR_AA31219 [Gossypium barbadense]|uniref:Uncharacterized protein n=1 Tax=Gossypium barbadense TaxID=3634 RepID=A0A2P5WEG1_GOSBA|nr:hypothetical protein GOBAR_AA31219 [Gossypium barbadense]